MTDEEQPKAPWEPKSDDEYLQRFKSEFKDDDAVFREWEPDAREDYEFAAGHQWSDEDEAALREQERPIITFNMTEPYVATVTGLEANNRMETIVIPRDVTDSAMSEVASELMKKVRDDADAEDQEADAFEDTVICGMSWVEDRMLEGDDEFAIFERVDPFEMRWQTGCNARNLETAKRIWRVRRVDPEEAQDMFPDADPADLDAAWADVFDDDEESPHIQPRPDRAYKDKPERGGELPARVTLIERQWYETVPRFEVDGPDGEPIEIEREDAQMLSEIGVKARKVGTKQVEYRAFIGRVILEMEPLPVQGSGFTYKAITGKYDRKKKSWYGLVRAAKDPQRFVNKFFSLGTEMLAASAKGTTPFYETGAIENMAEFQRTFASSREPTEVAMGALSGGKIQPKRQGEVALATISQLMEFATGALPRVTGINYDMMGQSEGADVGVVLYQRKQSAITILAKLFDNLRRHRKRSGRLLLAYILKYMTPDEMARIVGPELGSKTMPPEMPTAPQPGQVQPPMMPMGDMASGQGLGGPPGQNMPMAPADPMGANMQPQQGFMPPGLPIPPPPPPQRIVDAIKQRDIAKYDLKVDESPSAPNSKDRAWMLMQPLLPMIIAGVQEGTIPPAILADIVEYSPLPSQLASKIATALNAPPDPQQVQQVQQQKQTDMATAMALLQNSQADSALKQAQAQKLQAEIPLTQAKTQHEMAGANKDQVDAGLAPVKAQMDVLQHAATTAGTLHAHTQTANVAPY